MSQSHMHAQTVRIRYSCALCRLKDIEVEVKARTLAQDISDWMNFVMIIGLGLDHHIRSPRCHPDKLTDIKIPMHGELLGAGPVLN